LKLTYSFETQKKAPEVEMELPLLEIDDIFLSIANREMRNGATLFQQRHICGTRNTSERKPECSDINITIPGHFQQNFGIDDVFQARDRYLVLSVGDCTANLFRPSFDSTKENPFYFLKHEPFEKKEYYGFIVQMQQKEEISIRIEKIGFRDQIPFELENGKKIDGLKWLFCSTPLVYHGQVADSMEMAVNDYDLRHSFGKNAKELTDEIYFQLRESHEKFVEMIDKNRAKILTTGPEVEWYHAGIGIKENKIIVIHNIGSLMELAVKFKSLGVNDAVLLDSGGSSVIWANWNLGGTLAHYLNYRAKRGAAIIIRTKGQLDRQK